MKKTSNLLLNLITSIIIFVIIIIACKENTIIDSFDEKFFINPYHEVGIIHTRVFEDILCRLENKKIDGTIKLKDIEPMIMNFCKESLDKMLKFDYNFDYMLKHTKGSEFFKSAIDPARDLNPMQKNFSMRIDNLLDEFKDINILSKELKKLDKEVSQVLTENESSPILCKSSVALSSKIYWKNNFANWLKIISNDFKVKKSSKIMLDEDSILVRLAKADAAGALAGALVALGVGQLELIPGMAAEGAAYATAIEAAIIIMEIIADLIVIN